MTGFSAAAARDVARLPLAVSLPRVPPSQDTETNSSLDAAVVVVNYRTATLVERCLAAVDATAGELRLEQVVVDNASGNGSAERLRANLAGRRVISMAQNRGFAAGVNAGFRHTDADIVILLNPDTEVRPGALQAMVARMREQPRAGVVAPLLENSEGRLAPNGYRHFPGLFSLAMDLCIPIGYALSHAQALHPYAMSPAALRAGRRPAWASGAALAIRRAAYAQAGPFDEGFFLYLEETEWQQRVARHGWTIEVTPAARVRHLVRGGGEESLAHSPDFVTSALRYLRLRGVPVIVSRAVLSLSLLISWTTFRLIACLPAKRTKATLQARAYHALLRRALTDRA